MKIQFELAIGDNKFLITEEAETQAEFVEKMAFFTKIPKTGPNGEDDLELVFRTTSQGHKYYSLVSKKADQEFMFGQSQKRPGELFEKGWQPLYKGDNQNQAVPQQAVAQPQAVPQPQVQQQVPQAAPAPIPAPAPQQAAPVPMPQAPAPVPAQVPQVQTPVQQAPVGQGVATAPQVTSQQQQVNNQAANDVLSQFGITR